MSEYPVLLDVSETLRDVLWTEMSTDSRITGILPAISDISFEPPFRLFKEDTASQNTLSIFLFRVLENPDLKNRPLLSSQPPNYRYPPLALNLFYVITPLTNSAENDQRVIGKVMHVFYDHAIISGSELRGLLQTNAEEIRLSLSPTSLEDTTKLWCAFLRPYRLSVTYEAR